VRFGSLHQKALLIFKQAEKEAERARHSVELQLQEQKSVLQNKEVQLTLEKQRQALFHKQLQQEQGRLKKDRFSLERDRQSLLEKSKAVEKIQKDLLSSLERISLLTKEEAKIELVTAIEKEAETELAQKKEELSKQAETTLSLEAQTILLSAVERLSQGSTKEQSITEVPLSSEQLIPRLIGKGGRNIQMLEQALDVALTVNQTPPSLLISAHDPQARYLATITVKALLETEKITPVIVRDILERVSQQMEHQVLEEGNRACQKIGLSPLPEKLSALLGSLLFRSSVGQNTLKHSIEVAELMGMIATRMGLDATVACTMGLLHDIGKALPAEWGLSHALAGKKFLEQFDLSPLIINAVASHHRDEAPQSLEARLLPICDRISAQPQGVRKESNSSFLSIVQECETVAEKVPEIASAWAHYAGSHIEVLIRPECERPDLYTTVCSTLSPLQTQIPITVTMLPPR